MYATRHTVYQFKCEEHFSTHYFADGNTMYYHLRNTHELSPEDTLLMIAKLKEESDTEGKKSQAVSFHCIFCGKKIESVNGTMVGAGTFSGYRQVVVGDAEPERVAFMIHMDCVGQMIALFRS